MSAKISYIGRTKKKTERHPIPGIIVCAVADDATCPERAIATCARWMRAGLKIEKAPTEWVKKHFMTTDPVPAEGAEG